MLTAPQLLGYYPDLQDARTKTALALVHSRFSTNTFPSWELAHPYRMIAHNGEINTLRGNVNWMRARESQLASELFGDDLQKVLPVVRPGGSDSATFDNVLELLVLAGRSLPARGDDDGPGGVRGPRRPARRPARPSTPSTRCLMEPWDGPAAVAFTDGRVIGATLDRNGLRPGRWLETKRRLGRARLGDRRARRAGRERRCARAACSRASSSSSTSREGRIVADDEVKREVATAAALRRVVPTQGVVHLDDLPERAPRPRRASRCAPASSRSATRRRTCASCSRRWPRRREEPIGSMGNDLALAVLSRPPAAAVPLLQAALRAGHQPADRPDPRDDRDVRRARASAPSATCSTRRPSTRTSSSMQHADPAQRASSRSCARSTPRCSARTR